MSERYSRGNLTAREASKKTQLSLRTIQRWTSKSRADWIDEKAQEREEIRAYHDDLGYSWAETAAHFGLHYDTVKRRAYRARKERAEENRNEIFNIP